MEKAPQILHLSYKEALPDCKHRWLKVNIVFKVFEEHDKISCEANSSPWAFTSLFDVEDPKQIDEYYANGTMVFSSDKPGEGAVLTDFKVPPEYDISDKKRTGWVTNHDQILTHIKKFDVYRYQNYVEDNAATRGALSLLENLKENSATTSRFVCFSTLLRSLRVLDTFWD